MRSRKPWQSPEKPHSSAERSMRQIAVQRSLIGLFKVQHFVLCEAQTKPL